MPIHIKYRTPEEPAAALDALIDGCMKIIDNLPSDPEGLADARTILEALRAQIETTGAHQATGVLMLAIAYVDRKAAALSSPAQ